MNFRQDFGLDVFFPRISGMVRFSIPLLLQQNKEKQISSSLLIGKKTFLKLLSLFSHSEFHFFPAIKKI